MSRLRPFREMNPFPIGVGFIVVVVLVLMASFNLGRLPFVSGKSYTAAFAEAAGLRKGDKVCVAGVAVGSVRSVRLEGTHVKVTFTVDTKRVHLGSLTTASIQIFTLLGNKYVALEPDGPGSWPRNRELPLTQTASPYDVEPAFQDLAKTVDAIDTHQLAQAFDTLAATFKNSPPAVRSMLTGLSRLSQAIASRDEQLGELLRHASAVTGVLADRRKQFAAMLGDGDRLLRMLDERRQVIHELLANTSAMSEQLVGLVRDNQAAVKPLLAHLHSVVGILDANQENLDTIVKELYVFVRGEVSATGSGPWFDGAAINVANPFQVGGATPSRTTVPPGSLGDLLGVGTAQRALTGRR